MNTDFDPTAHEPGLPVDEFALVHGADRESERSSPTTWRRFTRQRLPVLFLFLLCALIMIALLAPWLAPYEPNAVDPANRLAGPSLDHLLGTDQLGRDMLSRLMFGARVSLVGATVAVVVAVAIGLPMGLISGYLGGGVDQFFMRVNDAVMSFPALMLAVAIVAVLGPSLRNAMTAIGIVYAPRIARVARGATLAVREETYVESARALGGSWIFIVRRHVLPNILSPLIVQMTLSMSLAILAEASLSFLGLGVQPPNASWGSLLQNSFRHIRQAPLNIITPGVAIMIAVLSFNVVGDGLRDAMGRQRRKT